MDRIIIIENLAERIVDFMGIHVTTETVAGMIKTLWHKQTRKGIAADLKGIANNCDSDEEAYEASMLWREVMAL